MRRHRVAKVQGLSGFTLIELMVVVAIIGLLAAVVIPSVLGHLQERQGDEKPVGRIAQAAPSASVLGAPEGTQPPVIESSDVRVTLNARPMLDGVQVHAHYDANFTGTFVVRNADPAAEQLHLFFPFPPGISEARDVSLQLLDARGNAAEAPGAAYELGGVRWIGRVRPGEAATVVVSYTARGQDAFVYDVAGKGRSGAVRFEVQAANAGRLRVPAEALQPTGVERDRIVWSFRRLVTNQPLVVELPAEASPLGRLILLCQLAALAVLLFGGGFWYLSELHRPGSLDDFRWGHFLLLALDYTLFFGAFAVVGYRGQVGLALGVACAVSLPLLSLHVARLSGWRFALRSNLPLAALTLSTVVAGVYAEESRAHLFLGVVVVVFTFLTLTHRRWTEGRERLRKTRGAAGERLLREAKLREKLKALEGRVDAAAAAAREAARRVEAPGEGLERERADARAALARLEVSLAEARALRPGDAAPEEPAAHEEWVRERLSSVGHHARVLEAGEAALETTLRRLETKLAQAREREAAARVRATHCLACGAARTKDSRFCPECGTAGPLSLACPRCGDVLELPLHLLRGKWSSRPLHCAACGEVLPPAPSGAAPPAAPAQNPAAVTRF